jgi:hypothetical protein
VRTVWNTQTHSAGRAQSVSMLKQMVHIVTTGVVLKRLTKTTTIIRHYYAVTAAARPPFKNRFCRCVNLVPHSGTVVGTKLTGTSSWSSAKHKIIRNVEPHPQITHTSPLNSQLLSCWRASYDCNTIPTTRTNCNWPCPSLSCRGN